MKTKKRSSKNLVFVLIVIISLFLMGVGGCPQMNSSGGTQHLSTSASNQGLDFSLISGMGLLGEGSKINLGETFKLGIHLENYDLSSKSGEICIKDDIDDVYGGISNLCVPFYVKGSDYENGKILNKGQSDIYLPLGGEYRYHDFPLTQTNANVFVIVSYVQNSTIQGSVSVPQPQEETLSLIQNPEVISLSINKRVFSKDKGYQSNFGITFENRVRNSKVYTPDFNKRGILFNIRLSNYLVSCPSVENGFIEMENKKFIRCSALLPKEQITHPVILNMDYGVKLNKKFSFIIQK